jgi:hypothetical protein
LQEIILEILDKYLTQLIESELFSNQRGLSYQIG